MKVCDKTCIFCFFPIINKYLCMAKRSLLSRCSSYLLIHLGNCHSTHLKTADVKHVLFRNVSEGVRKHVLGKIFGAKREEVAQN